MIMEEYTFIKEQALGLVRNSPQKITPAKLEKILCTTFSLNKQESKQLIKDLVACEELVYTYQFGNTYLERSFEKPIRISSRIILSPPNRSCYPEANDIVITIAGGGAFGSGAHPTTRLCLRAMDQVLTHFPANELNPSACLDIGTGSGVLVIAAVKLGIKTGIGLDIDAMALAEARRNVYLNRLGQQIRIEETPLEQITGPFCLITANLRYPTLSRLANSLYKLLSKNGHMVLSGFRPHEKMDLGNTYAAAGFEKVKEETENEWAGMILKKQ